MFCIITIVVVVIVCYMFFAVFVTTAHKIKDGDELT